MRTHCSTVAACLSICGLIGSTAFGETKQTGEVFKLEAQPLPEDTTSGFHWYYFGLSPLKGYRPAGVKGVELRAAKLQVWSDRTRHQLILAKSSKDKDRYDRAYVDHNGDGRLDKDERYDLTRSHGIVQLEGQGSNRHEVHLRPVKLVHKGKDGESARWVALWLRDQNHILAANVTSTAGNVRFGDKDVRLALFSRAMRSEGGFAKAIEFPSKDLPEDRRYVRTYAQVLFDANGNGKFDNLRLYDTGPENQWLTRLVRVNDAYYAIQADKDGLSVRITPAKPKVGTLTVPDHVDSLIVLGPEFAGTSSGKDKKIELPAGMYVVYQYNLKTPKGTLSVGDRRADAVFEIRPGKETRIETGPPLAIAVSHSWMRMRRVVGKAESQRSEQLQLQLVVKDCAGREVTGVNMSKGGRPPAPKFKVVDSKGKTVLDDAFKYG